jgi:hypothetical protein
LSANFLLIVGALGEIDAMVVESPMYSVKAKMGANMKAKLACFSANSGKQPAKDAARSTPVWHTWSPRREFAVRGQTAVPQSFSAIPVLAQNEATPDSLSLLPLQCRLAVGAVNDPLESEADAMADRVLRGQSAPAASHAGSPAVYRKCSCESSGESCPQCGDEKENKLLRKSAGPVAPMQAPPIVHEVLNSPGQLLNPATRSFMEPRFGYDFSRVRVHADERAAESARSVNALAYTVNQHVVFGAGQHNPGSNAGRHLLAHELTHVVQQQSITPAVQRQPLPPRTDVSAVATEIENLVRPQRNEKAALERLNSLDQDNLLLVIKKLEADSAAVFAGPDTTTNLAAFEKDDGKRMALAILNGALTSPPSPETQNVNVARLKAAFDAVLYAPAAGTSAVTAGSGKRGPSAGVTAAPSEEKMEEMAKKSPGKHKKWQAWLDTRDEKAREFGAADYEDYVKNMLVSGGAVFGRSIPARNPVHPLFLDRLEAASQKAQAKMPDSSFGIRSISGQDNRPGNHAWGLAVDIDVDSNPYILNESGEQKLDAVIAPIYERIAQALLHRSSVITLPAAGKRSGLETATYDQLAEESDAMAAYFSVLKDSQTTAATTPPEKSESGGKKAQKAPAPLPPRRDLTGRQFNPKDLQSLNIEQVKNDYAILKGPAPAGTTGDTPFSGGGPSSYRDPARGFLSIRKEVVEALRGEGLRWGATDFPGASGDVMHFDDQDRHSDYATYGKAQPTDKRKLSGG